MKTFWEKAVFCLRTEYALQLMLAFKTMELVENKLRNLRNVWIGSLLTDQNKFKFVYVQKIYKKDCIHVKPILLLVCRLQPIVNVDLLLF